ncbi:MAG: undecaprenyl-phosphate glucose phosphotransferase [Hyphomicrobiaceae bacterium]
MQVDTAAPDNAGTAVREGRGLAARIAAFYRPDRKGVSRPKLLFSVALADMAVVSLAGIATSLIAPNPVSTAGLLIGWLFAQTALVIVVLRLQRAYSIAALRRMRFQVAASISAMVAGLAVLAGIAHLARVELVAPNVALGWIILGSAGLIVVRYLARRAIETLAVAGLLVRRTVIVGGGNEALALIERLAKAGDSHIRLLGVFDDRADSRTRSDYMGHPLIGSFEQLSAFCRQEGVELLIVALPLAAEHRLLQVLHRLFELPVDIRISALNSRLPLSSKLYSHIAGVPMVPVMDKPLNDWDRAMKNLEDRVLGLGLFLLALPAMALIALAVRLDSRGPVLFKQRRYGFDNELIEVYKFRSMYVDQADADAARLVTRDDPRVTRVGRILRRSSLDELPQLINVLRGEMSLVGPRPHATQAKAAGDLYEHVVLGYFARHRVKPGVTGWAQINGWRGETDTAEKLKGRIDHDLHYIDNWSVPFDLYIIAMTPIALIACKNAY